MPGLAGLRILTQSPKISPVHLKQEKFPATTHSMLFEVRSTETLDQTGKRLQESAAHHQFGVISVQDLKATMARKGVDYQGKCVVYEVCNPHQAHKVLEANPAISTALPWCISMYRDGDGYQLTTPLPAALLNRFNYSAGREPLAKHGEQK